MRQFILPLYLLLGACMPVTSQDTATRSDMGTVTESALPPIKVFSAPRPVPPHVSNRDLSRDFLDLAFQLESGRALPVLTRFDGPISVRVTGAPPPNLVPDLNRLLYRLRSEAGMDINQTAAAAANVTIEAVPRSAIRKTLPQAACFVAPNVSSLGEYRSARRSARVNWSRMTARTRVAIFLPNDASPQEVRDCLHEELAQALGPLNDLYRLPDSVFNDDNVHTVLTGFDMLVLRIYYDPALRNGMRRSEAARRLPAVLARLNPAGEGLPPRRLGSTPRAWINAVQEALGPGASPSQRQAAAREAVKIAGVMGWSDHRRGFAHYAMGRILQASDPKAAHAQFTLADRYFGATPGTGLHRAYTASQLAAYAISQNRPDEALALLGGAIDIAARHENAALLATLMLLRAEALDLAGRVSEGREVRMDSLGWARYGFGPDWAVRAKLREIGSLNPLKGNVGRI
ncbi:DUF2927 domain-containing protein [Puniceibacterium sp. IMCC21224]|uniref:DUF2927 domain-containing protein n=1 Tax=Puniceibacterium sp. IMCC21224 TaxID=1618204 RepID=UPI00064DE9AD|nr:DUF2927 domain-containing protein [Puniceibacterium sp. IMCC21224]KMK66863.1 Protein of unknown function (DUF2927) [Puniceibacterium sp. IMCC21224]